MYCVYRRYTIQQGVNNYRRYNYYKKGRALFALCLFFFSYARHELILMGASP